ncbi:MAG: hypothetical protein MJK14_16070 [Rivularia sp. ALOHA_DT_140]|nr:hypothetical protein [Rivularia sp. ALOHA_DT_140]
MSSTSPQRLHRFLKIFLFTCFLLFCLIFFFEYIIRVQHIVSHHQIQSIWTERGIIQKQDISEEDGYLNEEFKASLKVISKQIGNFAKVIEQKPVKGINCDKDLAESEKLDKSPSSWLQKEIMTPHSDLKLNAAIIVDNKKPEEFSSGYCSKVDAIFNSFYEQVLDSVAKKVVQEWKGDVSTRREQILAFNLYSDFVKKNILIHNNPGALEFFKNIKASSVYLLRDEKVLVYPYFNENGFENYSYLDRPWWASIKASDYAKFGISSPYQDIDRKGNFNLVRTLWYKFSCDDSEKTVSNSKCSYLLFDLFIDSDDVLSDSKKLGVYNYAYYIVFSLVILLFIAQLNMREISKNIVDFRSSITTSFTSFLKKKLEQIINFFTGK